MNIVTIDETTHVTIFSKDALRTYPSVDIPKHYRGTIKQETRHGYALLADMLRRYKGILYDATTIAVYPDGKPYQKDNYYYFTISYSKDYVACAVGFSELGIDIEQQRPDLAKIRSKFLSPIEAASEIDLLETWVIKEAYSKKIGSGLKLSFLSVAANELRMRYPHKMIKSSSYVCVLFYENKQTKIHIERDA